MKRHIRVHTGEQPYSCEYCPTRFSLNSNCLTHMRNFHPQEFQNQRIIILIIICNYFFLISDRGLVFCCFIVVGLLRMQNFLFFLQNLPIKLGDKKYACPYCCRIMNDKRDVARHIRTHTGEKPFACEICEFASAWKSALRNHVKSKHGLISEQINLEKKTQILSFFQNIAQNKVFFRENKKSIN